MRAGDVVRSPGLLGSAPQEFRIGVVLVGGTRFVPLGKDRRPRWIWMFRRVHEATQDEYLAALREAAGSEDREVAKDAAHQLRVATKLTRPTAPRTELDDDHQRDAGRRPRAEDPGGGIYG